MKIKKLSKRQLIIFIIIAVILLATVPTGIYCGVKKETPAKIFTEMFTDQEKLINKWQGEKAASAYEFKDDGTYESFISTISFSGNYKVEGNKITLFNPGTSGKVVYKYNISKKDGVQTLTLVLVEENGQAPENAEEVEYKQVDHINTKSFSEILSDYAKEAVSNKEKD